MNRPARCSSRAWQRSRRPRGSRARSARRGCWCSPASPRSVCKAGSGRACTTRLLQRSARNARRAVATRHRESVARRADAPRLQRAGSAGARWPARAHDRRYAHGPRRGTRRTRRELRRSAGRVRRDGRSLGNRRGIRGRAAVARAPPAGTPAGPVAHPALALHRCAARRRGAAAARAEIAGAAHLGGFAAGALAAALVTGPNLHRDPLRPAATVAVALVFALAAASIGSAARLLLGGVAWETHAKRLLALGRRTDPDLERRRLADRDGSHADTESTRRGARTRAARRRGDRSPGPESARHARRGAVPERRRRRRRRDDRRGSRARAERVVRDVLHGTAPPLQRPSATGKTVPRRRSARSSMRRRKRSRTRRRTRASGKIRASRSDRPPRREAPPNESHASGRDLFALVRDHRPALERRADRRLVLRLEKGRRLEPRHHQRRDAARVAISPSFCIGRCSAASRFRRSRSGASAFSAIWIDSA